MILEKLRNVGQGCILWCEGVLGLFLQPFLSDGACALDKGELRLCIILKQVIQDSMLLGWCQGVLWDSRRVWRYFGIMRGMFMGFYRVYGLDAVLFLGVRGR